MHLWEQFATMLFTLRSARSAHDECLYLGKQPVAVGPEHPEMVGVFEHYKPVPHHDSRIPARVRAGFSPRVINDPLPIFGRGGADHSPRKRPAEAPVLAAFRP